MDHEDFLQIVFHAWAILVQQQDKVKKLVAKFKNLRRVLRAWQAQISNLSSTIKNVRLLLSLLELMEEYRDLSLKEWNFIILLKDHLESLLHGQKIYWKQRSTVKWVKFRDVTTEFFHARAIINHKGNQIMLLQDEIG